jgi:hypothetical protein
MITTFANHSDHTTINPGLLVGLPFFDVAYVSHPFVASQTSEHPFQRDAHLEIPLTQSAVGASETVLSGYPNIHRHSDGTEPPSQTPVAFYRLS